MAQRGDISVIITAYNRPDLVPRAVRSALDQTLPPREVIVVVDGPNDAIVAALKVINDQRLRVIVLETNRGIATARNIGVQNARSHWLTFLDDDDEWMPTKLQLQMEAAQQTSITWPIITCHILARTEQVDLVWPRRQPRPGEPICEYLFCRSMPAYGEGLITISTSMIPRELMLRVPLTDGMRRLDDFDWLLRVARYPGVGFVFPQTSQPQMIYHMEETRSHISRDGRWRDSLVWAQTNRGLFTRRAYAAFICSSVSRRAGRSGQFEALPELFAEARRHGQFSWVDLVTLLSNFTIMSRQRNAAFKLLKRLRPGGD